MRSPQQVRQPGLPKRVTIYEVGPRDGLQNEQTTVTAAVKAEFIARLADAGLRVIEATSFVHPKWVPQLADAEELLDMLTLVDGVRYPVLVPNERGLERALAKGIREIAIFGSATETFAQRNLNRSVDESIAMFAPVVERARAEGLTVRAYVSMCFGDPWEGDVAIEQVVGVGARLLDLGHRACRDLDTGMPADAVVAAEVDQGIDHAREDARFAFARRDVGDRDGSAGGRSEVG